MLNLIFVEQDLLILRYIKMLRMYLNLKRKNKIKISNTIVLVIKEENYM